MRRRGTISLEELRKSACAKIPANEKLLAEFGNKKSDSGNKTSQNGKIVTKHFRKKSTEKNWMGWNLLAWCNEKGLQLHEEYKFENTRRWRFDWAIPALMIAVEYEGLFSEKSRHTTPNGFTGDSNKYNHAQMKGWKVLRFTALNYNTLITQLNQVYETLHL